MTCDQLFTRLALPLVLAASMAGQASAQSTANIAIDGAGNMVTLDQQGAEAADAAIDQSGNSNEATVVQEGPDKKLLASMVGDALELRALQTGAAAADLTFTGVGADNLLDASQTGDIGGMNIAVISQSGIGNQADIDQIAASGAANELTLVQDGNDNIATLAQEGSGNILGVTQQGDGNLATIDQSGVDLGLDIAQMGGASVIVTQTSF